MKRISVALGILLFGFMVSSTAYAGSLNQYESEVVEAAKKTYEYKGVLYEVDETYLNQLIDYLSSDGVDLTAEQKDEVIQSAYDSIENGVAEGYLKPSAVQPVTTPSPGTGDSASADDPTASEETDADGSASDITDQEQNGNTSMDTGEEPSAGENTSGKQAGNGSAGNKEPATAEELIENILKDPQAVTPTPAVQDSLEGSIFDSMNQGDTEDNSIIKNTGFDFTDTIIVIVGMGVLMLVGIYVTVKSNLFAHKDE
jgi:hypothetical protein